MSLNLFEAVRSSAENKYGGKRVNPQKSILLAPASREQTRPDLAGTDAETIATSAPEILVADIRDSLENFTKKHFPNLKQTRENFSEGLASRERGLASCRVWDMEAAINKPVEWMDGSQFEEGKSVEFEPLIIDRNEFEDQENPKTSVMARIMTQYRRDLGFRERLDLDFNEEVTEEDLLELMNCYGYSRERLAKIEENSRYKKLARVREAYSFFRYLGKVPYIHAISAEECVRFKIESGFTKILKMVESYDETLKAYTFLDWDNLDLTHFEYQLFPVVNKIVRNLSPNSNPNYTGEGILTVGGMRILAEYVDSIRFHNPKTIEGRRMLLFQKLYRLYFKATGDAAHPNFIDWSHCRITSADWPENMSRSDVNEWTDEQIEEMNQMLKSNLIVFKFKKMKKSSDAELFLGNVRGFETRPVVRAEFAYEKERAKDIQPLSDSEEVCGNNKPTRKYNLAMKKMETEDAKAAKANEKMLTVETARELPKIKKKRSEDSDDSSEFDSDAEASPSKKMTSKPPTPRRVGVKSFKDVIIKSVHPTVELKTLRINGSDERTLASEHSRTLVLGKIRVIYDEDTGTTGQEIEWDRAQVLKMEYHQLPFRPDLRSVADVKIANHVIKYQSLAFHNFDLIEDRRIRIYERLYTLYVSACGTFPNGFDIFFEDVDVFGWPEEVGLKFEEWNEEQVQVLSDLLDKKMISFAINSKFQAEIDAEIQKRNGEIKSMAEKSLSSSSRLSEKSSSSFSPLDDNLDSPMTTELTPTFASLIKRGNSKSSKEKRKANVVFMESEGSSGTTSSIEEASHSKKSVKAVHDLGEKAGAEADSGNLVNIGEFAGTTFEQLENLKMEMEKNVHDFSHARSAYQPDTRQYRIYTEILRGLGLLLQHVTYPLNLSVIPRLPREEIQTFLDKVSRFLTVIQPDGSMLQDELKRFVITAVKMRARLAGIKYKRNGRGKLCEKLYLSRERITNVDLFGFLTRSEANWDIGLLELFLYDGETELFTLE